MQAKQEALQLHTVLDAASQSAAAGDHAAAMQALAPVLLCCTGKEQQILQLDQQQWLSGMQILLAAAAATGSRALALKCHLRLLNALLPAVPPQVLGLVQGKEEEVEAAVATDAVAALHAAAEQLVAQPGASAALDAAASFLQRHTAELSLAASLSANGGSNSSTIPDQQLPSQQQQQQLALHPMERAMYEDVQHQAAFALASLSSSLAAVRPAAAESCLSLKVGKLECAGARSHSSSALCNPPLKPTTPCLSTLVLHQS